MCDCTEHGLSQNVSASLLGSCNLTFGNSAFKDFIAIAMGISHLRLPLRTVTVFVGSEPLLGLKFFSKGNWLWLFQVTSVSTELRIAEGKVARDLFGFACNRSCYL